MKRNFYLLLALFLSLAALVRAQTPQLQLTQFSTGFSNPIGIFNAGDSRLFVVEQTGKIFIVNSQGVRNPVPFLDISSQVSTGGERGLLGLAFPNFSGQGHFFVNYTNTAGATVISRFSANGFNPDLAIPGSEEIILTIPQPYANHNGGNIVFGPDGYLYIGMGDGGSGGDPDNYAQNRQSLLGKMLRLDVTSVPYSIPADNPFVNNASTLDEIWAIGLRNPWRFSFDRITGDMWIGDVGQSTWEEINFESGTSNGGLNYGWRCYEGNVSYNTAGCPPQSDMTFPVSSYQNNSANGCSVTGGFVYRGGKSGKLYGHYIFTDYCSGRFRSVVPDGAGGFTTTQLDDFLNFQYASLGEDRYGELYVAGKGNGIIYKIEETTCEPTAVILGDTARIFCPGDPLEAVYAEGNSYQWYNGGQIIPGATNSTYLPVSEGSYHVVVTNAANCSATSGTVVHLSIAIPTDGINGLNQQYNLTDNPSTLSFDAGGTFSGPGINGNTFNPAVAGVGTHTISVTYTDACGDTQTHNQTVIVVDPNGIAESNPFTQLSLYPNPAAKDFTVSFSLDKSGPVTTQIVNTLGQVVFSTNKIMEAGNQQVPISMPSAANGMYLLRLSHASGSATTRFVLE